MRAHTYILLAGRLPAFSVSLASTLSTTHLPRPLSHWPARLASWREADCCPARRWRCAALRWHDALATARVAGAETDHAAGHAGPSQATGVETQTCACTAMMALTSVWRMHFQRRCGSHPPSTSEYNTAGWSVGPRHDKSSSCCRIHVRPSALAMACERQGGHRVAACSGR